MTRFLHTADWHMGDKLGWVDRTLDLERAVAHVAGLVESERADVLIVAGDLLSEVVRPPQLSRIVAFWSRTFSAFLARGGTVVAVTGNHDHEIQCEIVRSSMDLAAPPAELAESPRGRFYLATRPTLMRLAGTASQPACQFALLPYPTPTAYFDGQVPPYSSQEERSRVLGEAFYAKLAAMKDSPAFRADLPSILVGHVHVDGAGTPRHLFRIAEDQDVVLDPTRIWDGFDYVALGHIHKPQAVGGRDHVRYCGSIERMDLGERHDTKSVALLDIGPAGLLGPVTLLPLPATPLYEVDVLHGHDDLPSLRESYPEAADDLVNLHVSYTAGENLEDLLRQLDRVFPRWYARDWRESGELGVPLTLGEADRSRSFEEVVRGYLAQELVNHPEADREAVMRRVNDLLESQP